ncbi:leukocyte antigen CD37 isoform X2 [Sciurus carolinensis]|uniref:leukocyte antigen CD37 isoform X2 n=1 Tax=Sciurus carolinensis TaxID=30640 RepID=UPI001FB2BAE1|nr:leukocyte antigen CD37 isoform X2 [Sciurus carolinensis]
MSAQKSCLSLIKYFLFVFNLFFFVLGSLIFCFGIWILIDKTSFVSFVGLSFVTLQIWSKILAISGILTMGLALLGCVGALKELRCLLGLYFGMLLLLFATQITLGILISTQRLRLERRVQDIVLEAIQNYRADPEETAAEESWDYVQFQLSRFGPRARPRHSMDICVVPANGHIYREGCAQSLQKWLHNNLISIVGICLGVGLLEVSVMVLSLQLQRKALRPEPESQIPGSGGSSSPPCLSADSGGGRCGVLTSSGRTSAPWGGWGMAGACPNWGDKVPQGKLPMALGPWRLSDQDEEQPDTGSSSAEMEAEADVEAEVEGETDKPPE